MYIRVLLLVPVWLSMLFVLCTVFMLHAEHTHLCIHAEMHTSMRAFIHAYEYSLSLSLIHTHTHTHSLSLSLSVSLS
jgi:hypothetical protein